MRAGSLCAADLPVRLSIGGGLVKMAMVMPAREWADRLGVEWDTVRQRRYRGDAWSDAFQPYLRRTPFNKPDAVPAPVRRKQTISGALQMATLEIKLPEIAHVVIAGVSDDVKGVIMERIQRVLEDDFGATVKADAPTQAPPANKSCIKDALWVLS